MQGKDTFVSGGVITHRRHKDGVPGQGPWERIVAGESARRARGQRVQAARTVAGIGVTGKRTAFGAGASVRKGGQSQAWGRGAERGMAGRRVSGCMGGQGPPNPVY